MTLTTLTALRAVTIIFKNGVFLAGVFVISLQILNQNYNMQGC